jgi:hypothetical protein
LVDLSVNRISENMPNIAPAKIRTKIRSDFNKLCSKMGFASGERFGSRFTVSGLGSFFIGEAKSPFINAKLNSGFF